MQTLFIFQGGGPTPVINATLAAVLERAGQSYGRIFGLRHSFEIAAPENLLDLTDLAAPSQSDARARLSRTPGALLGSSRKRVDESGLEAVFSTMRRAGASDIIGIGGNGTMAALNKLSEYALAQGLPIRAVGAPKTVDNDLPGVHFAPGFGSAARFVALATRDFDCDFRAMQTFDDITILETMGRNTGWLAAASALLKEEENGAPHIVLVPERPVNEADLIAHIRELHRLHGRVFIVTNEMLTDPDGKIVGEEVQNGPKDSLGRTMYSLSVGVGNYLAQKIWQEAGLQARCLRPGNLGRAFSCAVSEPDRKLAEAVGVKAVDLIGTAQDAARMVTIAPDLSFGTQAARMGLGKKALPICYLPDSDPFGISKAFREDVLPIIGPVDSLYL